MLRRVTILTALVSALQAVACENAADQQKKVDTAQAKANDQIEAAKKEAEVKINSAQVQVDKRAAEANADFDVMRERFRTKTQIDLDVLDRKIAALDAKPAVGKAKAEFDAKMKRIQDVRGSLATDMNTLKAAPATTWDATKVQVEKALADLTTLVEKG